MNNRIMIVDNKQNEKVTIIDKNAEIAYVKTLLTTFIQNTSS